MDTAEDLLRDQSGVISHAQALAGGLGPTDVARLLRRRVWAQVHPGVYLLCTARPAWLQRAWAAVLWAAPAALVHQSARRAWEGPGRRGGEDGPIHVGIDRARRLPDRPGVRVHRLTRLDERVQPGPGPPRTGYRATMLDLAAAAPGDLDAVALLAGACGERRTTARLLLGALGAQPRLARRAWLHDVLADVADGTCAVVEADYLDRVVRPHGLPEGHLRPPRVRNQGLVRRDVEHEELALVVELDGRLLPTRADPRDHDDGVLDLLDGGPGPVAVVRLDLGDVHERPCLTASRLALVMQRRGWSQQPRLCPSCPARVRCEERSAG